MMIYAILLIEALPFLAIVIWGVRELILLDRYDRQKEESE